MTEIKGIKLWQWAVWLLVVCNLALLLTIWIKPWRQGPPPGRETPREYVIRNLRLTDEQIKRYDVLIKEHQQAMHQLREEAGKYRQALFSNLKQEYASNSFTDSLIKVIANNQKEIEIVTFNHFVQVRALCNDDQKKEFDKIIGDILKRMNPGPPHGGRPGGPPGNDGPPPPPGGDRPDDGPPRDQSNP